MEDVPDDDYEIALGEAEIMRKGSDVTLIGWGGQLRVLEKACDMAEQQGISCEVSRKNVSFSIYTTRAHTYIPESLLP